MADLKNIVYISNENYETLVTNGSVTVNGTTITYDANDLYITPEESLPTLTIGNITYDGTEPKTVTLEDLGGSAGGSVEYRPINVNGTPILDSSEGTALNLKNGSNVTITGNASGDVSIAANIPTSLKNPHALKFGSKTYDGSSEQTITASDLGAVTSDDISGKVNKFGDTMTGKLTIQSGDASGCLQIGADATSNTLTANTRKLARVTFPTKEYGTTKTCSIMSCDNLNGYNYIEFGGHVGDVTNTAPDFLYFIVDKEHNSLKTSTKECVMAISPTSLNLFNGAVDAGNITNLNSLSSKWVFNNSNTFKNSNYTYTLPSATGTIALTSNIPTTLKNPHALTFGSKTYDGSSAETITASDLGALTSSSLDGYVTSIKIGSTSYDPSSGVVTLPAYPSDYLQKTTYEWNKEYKAGGNGALSLGRYNVYDTQLTFDITTTTSTTLSGKLVIATQNGRIFKATIYGDASNTLINYLTIYQSAITSNRSWVEVFCNFPGWSKNKVHIYGVALNSATVTNQMISVTFTDGVPSGVTSGDTKWTGTIVNDITSHCATTNHTHNVSIATSTGTNELTLAHSTKYALTVGNKSFVFTTPADNNTTYSSGTGLQLSGTTFSANLNSTDSLGTIGITSNLYGIGVDSNDKLAVSIPSAGFEDVLEGITGRTKVEWNALNAGEYGSNSTYNGTTLPPVILESNSAFWNTASGRPLDVSFHFTKKEKITTLQVKCPPYNGTNPTMTVYYAQAGDTGLTLYREIATISTVDSKTYKFNEEGISADYWVVRFTASSWIDLRLCNPRGSFTTGLYTEEYHQQIMDKFNRCQPVGNYVTLNTVQTITGSKSFSNGISLTTINNNSDGKLALDTGGVAGQGLSVTGYSHSINGHDITIEATNGITIKNTAQATLSLNSYSTTIGGSDLYITTNKLDIGKTTTTTLYKLQVPTVSTPVTSNDVSVTTGLGTSGQALLSNGTNAYWGDIPTSGGSANFGYTEITSAAATITGGDNYTFNPSNISYKELIFMFSSQDMNDDVIQFISGSYTTANIPICPTLNGVVGVGSIHLVKLGTI